MEILLHIANILYLFSYSVKDIMALRVLTVVAASCLLPYFYFRSDPLYAAIAWNMLFNVINIYRIATLYAERKPVYFEEKDQDLYDRVFSSLTRQQFNKIRKISIWQEDEEDDDKEIFRAGDSISSFIVLAKGKVDIKKGEEIVEVRCSGEFIGEGCLLEDCPLKADVIAKPHTTYLSIPQDKLKKLLDDDPVLHASFQKVISQVLIKRLAI